MRVRLILIQTRSGVKARQEDIHEGDLLSIGRHSSSAVYIPELSVALNHAKIEVSRGRVRLDLLEGDHFTVNGHFKTAPQTLDPGTLVRIGHHELRVVEPAEGEDLALEIEKIESQGHAAEELEKRTKLGISGLLLTRRRLSWVLSLAVFWGFLVLPLSQSGSSGNFLGNNFLTRSWNPGPLAPSHQYFADDCETCHVNAFQSVPEMACLDCHPSIGTHSSRANEVAEVLAQQQCTSCHLEHNETRALASVNDTTCDGCHSDLASVFAATDLLDAGDFATSHPAFRPSAVIDVDSGQRERLPQGADLPLVRSGVPFAHESHLDGPIKDARDQDIQLECADCHRPEPAGTTMMPTLFERDCQRCHSLAFDALHEDDEAPHEEVVLVSTSMFQFYSALALEGEARDPEAPLPARRRPGREISEVERLGLVAWAEERTDSALDRLLGSEGVCVECHTVSGTGEIAELERLTPVPSPGAISWMPAAVFSHRAHDSISECEDCHSGVSEAEADSALLLPQIQLCLECHTGATPSTQRVTSPCILCHSFHQPRYGLLRSE